MGVARDSARSHAPRAPGRRREAHSYATANARATSGRLATRPSSAHNASELSHTAYPSHTLVVRATSFQGCLRPAAALDKAGAAGPLASPRRRRSADAAASPAEARGGTAIQPDLASTVIAPRAGTHSSPFPSHFSHLNLRSPLPSLLFPHLALMTPPRPPPQPPPLTHPHPPPLLTGLGFDT